MKGFFIFFSYLSFFALAITCAVITYQIVKHGVSGSNSNSEES